MCHPYCVRARWFGPNSATPNIAVAVPVVVAGLPYPSRVRSRPIVLNNWSGWSDVYINLRV
jgi:stringent starvation protein B